VADVQPDRAMPVHRDLFAVLNNADLTPSEFRMVLALIRASWGWGKTTTEHRFSHAVIESLTGIRDRKQRKRALDGLRRKGVIVLVREADPRASRPAEWALVKDYDSWDCAPLGCPIWRQAPGGAEPPGVESPQGHEAPHGVAPPGPPGCGTPQPPGVRNPPHEAQEEAQEEAQDLNVGGAPTLFPMPKAKTAAQVRAEQAETLIARWHELAKTRRSKGSKADGLRLSSAKKAIQAHGYEAIAEDLEALAVDEWWRGKNDRGSDAFKVNGPEAMWGFNSEYKRNTLIKRLDKRARGVLSAPSVPSVKVERWWREVDGHAQKARGDIDTLRVLGQIQTFDQALDYIARQEGAPSVQALRPIVARWWEDQR